MTQDHVVKLTAGELGHLWENYMNYSMSSVILEYFKNVAEQEDIRNLCTFALKNIETYTEQMQNLFTQEDYPLPTGFSDKDINTNAPKPVTDEFILFFLLNMAKVDLGVTAVSLTDAVRSDIRNIYHERMSEAMELHDMTTSSLLEKGLFVRPPLITSSNESDPMANEGFLANWFRNEPRSSTAREANELHKNILSNHLGKSLLIALHQTNKNPKLKNLLLRGKELASKIIEELSNVLIQNDLPVAMTWDTHVLNTTESPFSDRLIGFLVDQLNKFGVVNYGYAAAESDRKDLKLMYARIITDVYQYEADIKSFMIENKWYEKPPMALDRRKLSKV